MSNRYNERKKRYSRSRSKSWSRDNYIDRQNQRRFKEQYKPYKPRYDQRKITKDNYKQSHVSIDWKPRVNNQKSKHNYKYSRSRSISSSSSSSSSSSYSSSGSRSRISRRGQKKQRDSWRKRSNQRNTQRQKKKSHSRSDSRNYRKKQHYQKPKDFIRDDKKSDSQYQKTQRYQKHEKEGRFQSSHQYHKYSSGGYKPSNYYKPYQNTGGYSNYNKIRNDEQKWRENEQKRGIQVKKQIIKTKQANDINNYQKKTKSQEKKGDIQIQIVVKKKQQENIKLNNHTNYVNVQTIKKVQVETHNAIPQKQKVSKVTQLINQSKKNLEITPLTTNFLILDSYRSMKKFNVETLDPTLLSWLQKDFEANYEQQKSKVFGKQNIIGQQRQNARITLPSNPTEQQIQLKTQLQTLRGSMLTLNHLFRQLHMLQ